MMTPEQKTKVRETAKNNLAGDLAGDFARA